LAEANLIYLLGEELVGLQFVFLFQLLLEIVQLIVEFDWTLFPYDLGDLSQEILSLRDLPKVANDVEGVEEVTSFEHSHVPEPHHCSYHSLLFVCDETPWLSIYLNECLEDPCECISSFETGDGDSERDDAVVAVDSSEYSNCVLVIIIGPLSDEVISQVVAHHLTVLLEQLLHLRGNDNKDVRESVGFYWERV
jgi:hypothetical protein